MDSLEAFERARGLPCEALNYGSPIRPFQAEIIPLKLDASVPHIWQGFNRSAVLFPDEGIVMKAQKQNYVPGVSLPGDSILLDIGLANFEGTKLERQVFAMLQNAPHPNLLNCLDTHGAEPDSQLHGLIFFQKLAPMSAALPDADMSRRRRWAIELCSAFSHLESLGLIPTKTFVCDLGLDMGGRLKLVGFGASPRHPNPGVQDPSKSAEDVQTGYVPNADVARCNMQSAHQRLASCLHYILSGVDLDEQARDIGHARHSQEARRRWRETVRRGEYPIAAGAAPITDILQDAWTLKMHPNGEARSFAEVEGRVRDALGALDVEDEAETQQAAGDECRLLEERCRVWLEAQELEPRWMGASEYEEAVKRAIAECES